MLSQGQRGDVLHVVGEGVGPAEARREGGVVDAEEGPLAAVAGAAERQVRPVLGRQPETHGALAGGRQRGTATGVSSTSPSECTPRRTVRCVTRYKPSALKCIRVPRTSFPFPDVAAAPLQDRRP